MDTMLETEKAWLAGLFDGEGSVYCRLPKRYNVEVEIKMTDYGTLEKVNSLFPGRLVFGNKSRGTLGKKDQWRWSLNTKKSGEFLKLVHPYLVTKKLKAKFAIRLCQRPLEQKTRMIELNAIMRDLP